MDNGTPIERPTFWHLQLPITDELRAKVKEYHDWHKDKKCHVSRVIRSGDGYPALLVRVQDESGNWNICIDDAMNDYISEIASCPRGEEAEMIRWFQNSDSDDDEEGTD